MSAPLYSLVALATCVLVIKHRRCLAQAINVDLAEQAFTCPFANLGDAHAAIIAADAIQSDECFDADGVTLRIRMPADGVDDLKSRLRDATRDRVRFATPG